MSQDNRMFIHCPECGRQIAKSCAGTDSEQKCPKCGAALSYTVKDSTVRISVISHKAG